MSQTYFPCSVLVLHFLIFAAVLSINSKMLLKQLSREVNYCKRLFIHLLKHK